MNQLEAQSPETLQDKTECPFARPWLWRGPGLELKVSQKVVTQDADLLPGGVGPIVMGGDGV